MGRLHGGDHTEARKARNVNGCQHLRMFNAETKVLSRPGIVDRAFIGIEDLCIGPVADRVRAYLEPCFHGRLHQCFQHGRGLHGDAAVAGIIGIRFDQSGPAGAERAIGVELHRCLLYTSPSPRDRTRSRMPSSA